MKILEYVDQSFQAVDALFDVLEGEEEDALPLKRTVTLIRPTTAVDTMKYIKHNYPVLLDWMKFTLYTYKPHVYSTIIIIMTITIMISTGRGYTQHYSECNDDL